jgi:23S rRNA (pseudouridine1915-N3)-methyltransferase
LPWAKVGVDDYLKRLSRSWKLEWVVLREGPASVTTKRMLEASEGCRRLVLDERGVAWRSVELAGWISQQEQQGVKRTALLIGGAEGHASEVRAAADVCWSLSALTLQHELALLVAMEQLYRAGTIQRGEPYHREG